MVPFDGLVSQCLFWFGLLLFSPFAIRTNTVLSLLCTHTHAHTHTHKIRSSLVGAVEGMVGWCDGCVVG